MYNEKMSLVCSFNFGHEFIYLILILTFRAPFTFVHETVSFILAILLTKYSKDILYYNLKT